MHAKQKNGVILKYPYTLEDLQMENPSTSFDARFSLVEWYSKTDDGINSGAELVEVTEKFPPKIDFSMFNRERKQTPELVDGVWQLTWLVTEKTAKEKETFALNQLNATPE